MLRSARLLWSCCIFCCIVVAFSPDSIPRTPNDQVEFLEVKRLIGTRGGDLVVGLTADPSTFNQLFASGMGNLTVTDRLSADLVHVNRSTLDLEPSLATRWEVDRTGRHYTLHLRRGVRFSDGSPFSADDVVFTLQALADPKIQSPMAGQLDVDGAFPSIARIDDFTVRLSFPRPVGMGIRILDSISILPKSRLAVPHREGRLSAAWGPTVNPADVAGLGPFRLREYRRGVRIVLERNPYYWKKDRAGATLPYLDTITFLIIQDLNAEALRFRQGELDVISAPSLNPYSYATLRRGRGEYTLRDLGPGMNMEFLWFNLNAATGKGLDPEKLALFEKAEFRRAVSHALNREGMTHSLLLGLGAPQYGPVSTGNRSWHHPGIPRTRYDPEQARGLLARIGLSDRNGDGVVEYGSQKRPLEVTLDTSLGNTQRERMAEIIQDNLARIGVRVAVRHSLPNEIASRFLSSFDYEAILFGIAPTDITPDLQTNFWRSDGNIHLWQPNQRKPHRQWEAASDALISRLLGSVDPAARRRAFNEVQELWAAQMPVIPTITSNILVGWSNRLGNVRPSLLQPHLLWNAEELTKK